METTESVRSNDSRHWLVESWATASSRTSRLRAFKRTMIIHSPSARWDLHSHHHRPIVWQFLQCREYWKHSIFLLKVLAFCAHNHLDSMIIIVEVIEHIGKPFFPFIWKVSLFCLSYLGSYFGNNLIDPSELKARLVYIQLKPKPWGECHQLRTLVLY